MSLPRKTPAPTQQIQTRISNAVNKMPTYPDDIVLAKRLVDEWGRAFVKELDYRSRFCSVYFSMDRLQLARKK